ncbi:Gfo/Idh/MocA family oxidoreductase [Pseudomonas chlororaphis]|jgi:myo-inositol 2-dehydrogenase/D-chiro-inositol 1-dehydrogenase|uniref:Gfo/Idh/MocA family oxidoreductase n=1 Tax=Pseudomonas chlororaphis subsp. aurantiaca TaxID=86192 RepID=A0AAJ0ZGI0_9PSED|nr:Gfo/Idh/MocA family oxidoreductase [Pseudomonas chlororaphis]AZD21899.1 Myo-inositol 2-dehydrogenase [Pseudomonas chlororaphis subsp. aurantiaca]AZD48020.1 Myo-inositol 2-dehydrogenase [Pseudomonas chlororaphis subsp. aurantiaca]AZD54434.1 Myo-inositol 2-dehydrogenase [Pseudomonas chlororaphis subsp. aurantiaca]AZD60500.1 Myo-inositol 2-dehydrogenase [Pseudomonas chlororaphis subsp. aurantiaca]AZD72947.1 Myo-inositol 2-dehydrogenase [Pseudomonas chlororaphis subsp. aurantiaca]
MSTSKIIRLGLIGAGRMGSFHGQTAAMHIPGACLAAIADPTPGQAARLAAELGVQQVYTDPQQLLDDPEIDAVLIAAPARSHAELVISAARAGKGVFCEKPMAITLDEADRAIATAADARVPLQVGFNRRFAKSFRAAHLDVVAGRIGTPQLLRSLTRDPALNNPAASPQWVIFLETLIHDFDTLRYLNPGAEAVEVFVMADALIAPDYKAKGLLDTAVVTIRFDNGAIATAEASFQAVYGYDVRGEVFGSAGMLTMGSLNDSDLVRYLANGIQADTQRMDTDLLCEAYVAELNHFVDCLRTGKKPLASGEDARAALAIARACIESFQQGNPVRVQGAHS